MMIQFLHGIVMEIQYLFQLYEIYKILNIEFEKTDKTL